MDLLPAIILFGISAAVTPGPNNIMIMASGLNFGVRASMPHYWGICLGFPVMFFSLGFGLGYVFESYPRLHDIIKVFGIAYLLWLAWLIASAVPNDSSDSDQSKPLTFFQAALFQWLNPKAWVMVSGAIAAFTTSGPDINFQILQIGLVFIVLSFPSAALWMCFGKLLKRVVSNPNQQKAFNIVMALLLFISVLPSIKSVADRVL